MHVFYHILVLMCESKGESYLLVQQKRNDGVGLHCGGDAHAWADGGETVADVACRVADQDEVLADAPLSDRARTPPTRQSAR